MSTTEIILACVVGFYTGVVFRLLLLAVCGGRPRPDSDLADTMHEFNEAHRIENETWKVTYRDE